MIWHLRTPETERKCIKCQKNIKKGLRNGFTPKCAHTHSVSKDVAQLVYDFMSTFERTKNIVKDENTGKYHVSAEHDIIFCGDCFAKFCEKYLGRLNSKIEIRLLR